MPKWLPKVIVDAERNRRTLEKSANHFPWCGGGPRLGAVGEVGLCELMTVIFKP